MEVKKQHPKLRNFCFKITKHLSIEMADFINICSDAHVLQLYLVGSQYLFKFIIISLSGIKFLVCQVTLVSYNVVVIFIQIWRRDYYYQFI